MLDRNNSREGHAGAGFFPDAVINNGHPSISFAYRPVGQETNRFLRNAAGLTYIKLEQESRV